MISTSGSNASDSTSILQQRLQQRPPDPIPGSVMGPPLHPVQNAFLASPVPAIPSEYSTHIPTYHSAPATVYHSSQGPSSGLSYSSTIYPPQEPQGPPSQLQQALVGAQLYSGSVSPPEAQTSGSCRSRKSTVSPPPIEKYDKAKSPGHGWSVGELKQPKPPEKPLIPYLRFSKHVWENAKKDHPGLVFSEIGKIIGEQWRSCPAEVKEKFAEEYSRDKENYAQAQKAYLESPEYLAWLTEKTKRELAEEDAEKAAKQRAEMAKTAAPPVANHNRAAPLQTVGSALTLHGPLEELQSMSQRMLPAKLPSTATVGASGVQPMQLSNELDDDSDDYLKAKHVSATRFKRNNKLMAEVFSDSIVPDGRMVVNEQRMSLLRKQVQSLTHHQERLLMEQRDIIEKHEAKKQKLLEDSEAFTQKWNRVKEECKPVSKEQFQAMVDKHYKAMERIFAEYQAQNQTRVDQQLSVQPQLTTSQPVESLPFPSSFKTHDSIVTEPISSPLLSQTLGEFQTVEQLAEPAESMEVGSHERFSEMTKAPPPFSVRSMFEESDTHSSVATDVRGQTAASRGFSQHQMSDLHFPHRQEGSQSFTQPVTECQPYNADMALVDSSYSGRASYAMCNSCMICARKKTEQCELTKRLEKIASASGNVVPDRSPRNSPLPLNSVEAGYESPKEMVRLPGHGSPASKRPCSHSPPDQQKDGVPMRESANSSIPLKKRKGLAQYPEPGAQTPPSPETPVGSVSAESVPVPLLTGIRPMEDSLGSLQFIHSQSPTGIRLNSIEQMAKKSNLTTPPATPGKIIPSTLNSPVRIPHKLDDLSDVSSDDEASEALLTSRRLSGAETSTDTAQPLSGKSPHSDSGRHGNGQGYADFAL